MEFQMILKKSTTGLLAMAGLLGGLALTSAPAFARNGSNPPPVTSQLVPISQMKQLLACNNMMKNYVVSTPSSIPSNNG